MTIHIAAPESAAGPDAAALTRLLALMPAATSAGGEQAAEQLRLTNSASGGQVALPPQVVNALREVADALSNGQAVTIARDDAVIGTQRAADILGLSRPTVVALIERGELQAHVPGSVRRRLRLADVLAYKAELFECRTAFIAESSAMFEPVDDMEQLIAEAREHA
ncbi:MAG: excisionase family DNA-binding protein [Actinomycetales bacterium]|nr:excisionase family DNA-binding protein [Actinomycetales bacterium]